MGLPLIRRVLPIFGLWVRVTHFAADLRVSDVYLGTHSYSNTLKLLDSIVYSREYIPLHFDFRLVKDEKKARSSLLSLIDLSSTVRIIQTVDMPVSVSYLSGVNSH
jgi:hypothetical protein